MSPQLIITLAICALSALTSGGLAWTYQSQRLSAQKASHEKELIQYQKDYLEAALESQRLAARARTANDARVIAAQSASVMRERNLRDSADRSRAALVSLSDAASIALSTAQESHTACLERATTLSGLFVASAESYRRMAILASRHASDVQTLVEAWPQNLPAKDSKENDGNN